MAETVSIGATARRSNQSGSLILASVGALLAFLDVTIVNVAFPSIQATFDSASYSHLSWVLNSYNIVFAAILVAAGRLADVFGRRRTFAFGVLVFTVASAACAAAPTLGLLIAARVLQGVGAGLLVPASLALVVASFPPERRSHAVGIWGATAAFAAGIGPPLGGLLVKVQDWRLAFLVNVPLGILVLVVSNRILVESRAPGRKMLPDLRGAALLGAAMAFLTLGVIEGPSWGWTDPRVLGAFALAVAMVAGFVWSSQHHQVPVLDPQLLKVRTFAVGNAVTFLAGMGFYAYMLNNILWLHYVWGYSLLRSGLAVAPGAVVAAVVAGVLGHVADRRGHRLVAVPGALIWAAAYLWYYKQVGTSPDFLSQWLPGQVLSGIGVGATLPIVASAALESVPGGRYATASAVVSSTRQLGAVIGVALLVDIVGSPGPGQAVASFRSAWLLSVFCFLAAAVLALGLQHKLSPDVEQALPPDEPDLHVLPALSTTLGLTQHSPLLANLSAAARNRLLADSALVTVDAGDWLFRAGDATDGMYVVRSGRLEVMGPQGVLRELAAGDVVGELGVLTDAPRSADVRARRDSQLWRLTPERVNSLLERDSTALRALTTAMARQLQDNRETRPAPAAGLPKVVAVVGSHDGAPVQRVADLLEAELARHLRVMSSRSMTSEQLHHAEPLHDRVLLVAEDVAPEWRAFCLRQADRVVLVASSATPVPVPPEGWRGSAYLLLVGPPPTVAQLEAWYDAWSPRVSQVAEGETLEGAVQSLGRRLAGRSIGVAIAGGGARSLAAIGVVEELLSEGFSVDRLSGCSIGSVVASLFATGRDANAVDATCYEEFVRRNPFNDYRLPSVSLVKGTKTEAAIRRTFGDVLMEQLPRELTLVSTDLLSRQLVIHRRGSVGRAVRASLSLPGLYAPARMGDALHVDGGVLENLPVRPLTDFDEGPVVAVNIAAAASVRSRTGPPRMPTLGETLMRTMLMGGTSTLDDAKQRAAIVVTPDTRGIGLLEFHQLDRAREAGRVAGRSVARAMGLYLAAIPHPRSGEPLGIDLTDPSDGTAGAAPSGARSRTPRRPQRA